MPNTRYQPYPDYLDSGIEWLGEIPSHWETKRLKFIIHPPLQYGANESAEFDNPEWPRFIRITDVREDGTLRDETFRSLPESIANPYLLEHGDILFARSGATVGKTMIYRKEWGVACHAGYLIRVRIDTSRANPDYIYQFVNSPNYWNWISINIIQATIQNVSAEKYANLEVPLPDISEQSTIVAFLDRETARIDALIDAKRKLIALLEEKREAFINQVVTQGLDPTVPKHKSGIDWIGIP